MNFEDWLRTKLKNFKTKDQSAIDVFIQGLKLIKLGVNFRQIKSLIINKDQVAYSRNEGLI